MGALYTLSLARLGDRFRPTELTRANTAFVMIFHVGLLLGPASVGAAMRGVCDRRLRVGPVPADGRTRHGLLLGAAGATALKPLLPRMLAA